MYISLPINNICIKQVLLLPSYRKIGKIGVINR